MVESWIVIPVTRVRSPSGTPKEKHGNFPAFIFLMYCNCTLDFSSSLALHEDCGDTGAFILGDWFDLGNFPPTPHLGWIEQITDVVSPAMVKHLAL
jgi:hypothetical protein